MQPREPRPFRCVGCGLVREIEADHGRIRLNRETDDGTPCERCGAIRAWVLAGSDTEFYAFWQRSDVCRVGEHVAEGVREYEMAPPGSPIRLMVRACPEHVEELRNGWGGYVLVG